MKEKLLIKITRLASGTRAFLLVMALLLPVQACAAMQFLSIAERAVAMYDAPSLRAEKLYVASIYLPVEAVVNVEGWIKVRDSSGSLSWVESKFLSEQRFVIVTVPLADVFEMADENSPQIFQAQEGVVLEWLDSDTPGWIKVRHRDGQTGYVRVSQVWGS
jgi:SH3-like domain-containing protein